MKKSAIRKNRDARVKAEADKVLRQVAASEVLHDLNAGRGSIGDARAAKLVEAALADYRKRFPSCPARQTWLFYDGNPATKRIRGTPDRVDVYCTFCRVLLVNRAVWQRDYTDELSYHTTICALRCLAGQMDPGAPGTYRLPTEI